MMSFIFQRKPLSIENTKVNLPKMNLKIQKKVRVDFLPNGKPA